MAYWVDFKTDDPFTTTFAYNTANELTKLTESGVDTTFTYNDWGRTVTKQKTVGQMTYTATYGYMYGDKLKSVASDFPGDASEVAYNYDGLGKRRNKLVNDTDVTWWRWDAGWGMLAEYGHAGSWTVGTREMSYTLSGMLALADVPGANPGNGDYRYYAQDHLGSLRALFDDDATQTGMADYEPYGMIRTGAGPADTPGQTFTGKMLDVETMLYYFPFRYYSPMTARWMTRDPLGMVDGPNLYWYGLANPLSFNDPLGTHHQSPPFDPSLYRRYSDCMAACREEHPKRCADCVHPLLKWLCMLGGAIDCHNQCKHLLNPTSPDNPCNGGPIYRSPSGKCFCYNQYGWEVYVPCPQT